MIAADAAAILLTYVLADMVRCSLWMSTDWPEWLPGYGSTVRLHLKVLALLPLAWPLILSRLGWYAQKWRSWRWALRNALTATTILALLMAALALLFERERYPRAQIGFIALLLPATTMALRGISGLVGQWYAWPESGTPNPLYYYLNVPGMLGGRYVPGCVFNLTSDGRLVYPETPEEYKDQLIWEGYERLRDLLADGAPARTFHVEHGGV